MANPAQVTGAPEPVKAAPGAFLTPLFTDRRVAAVLGLGFAQGIPFLLVYATQSAWLVQSKVPLATIGLMSELTIAYKLKFLWAPFLDRHDAPLIGRWLGRRRGWIVATQILVALALAGVAFGDPAHWLAWTVAFSLALGVAGATQDVVIDGWRITAAPPEQQALMSSWSEIGYRIGNLAAGAGALYLSDAYGWRAAYLCMAALMAPGTVAALLAPEPPPPRRHRPADSSRPSGRRSATSSPGSGRSPCRCWRWSRASGCPATSRTPWRSRCSRRSATPTPTSPR